MCQGQEADSDRRLDHLLRAAAHLEQAGLGERAAEIRALIQVEDAAIRQRLLDSRLAALATLQAEIDELRRTEAAAPQVLIGLQLLSFQREKIHALGLSFAELLDQPAMVPVIDESGKLASFLDALRQQGLVRVLAEPTLLAVAGREATFTAGGFSAVGHNSAAKDPDSPDFRGTYVKCRPQVIDGMIALELTFRCAPLVPEAQRATAGGEDVEMAGRTRRSVTEVTTSIQVPPGQRAILGGQHVQDATAGDSSLILVVQAEILR